MLESLAFWQSLNYEVKYQQKAPNAYGVIRSDDIDIDLHLFGLDIEPKNNFSTCLVVVSELATLHETYAAKLKNYKGKSP